MMLCTVSLQILLMLPLITTCCRQNGQETVKKNGKMGRQTDTRQLRHKDAAMVFQSRRQNNLSGLNMTSHMSQYGSDLPSNGNTPLAVSRKQLDQIARDARRAQRKMQRQRSHLEKLNLEIDTALGTTSRPAIGKPYVPEVDEAVNKDLEQDTDDCQAWMYCQNPVMQEYLEQVMYLPSCPCHYPLNMHYNYHIWDWQKQRHFRWLDASGPEEKLSVYKPGAVFCVRTAIGQTKPTLAAQHCCYDGKLTLITRGRNAGTPNLISPEWSWTGHHQVDRVPWITCKGDWTRYNMVRPPNNMRGCKDNPSKEEYKRQISKAKYY